MKPFLKAITLCIVACAIASAVASLNLTASPAGRFSLPYSTGRGPLAVSREADAVDAAHIKPQPGTKQAGGSRKAAAARCKGRIKIVTAAANFNVRVVNAAADLDVKIVNAAPTGVGEWQIVNAGEDFTVKFVNAGEDFTIRYVNAAPGLH